MSDATPHVYDRATAAGNQGWRTYLPEGVRPYFEAAPLAALFLGISSGATFAMIGATLTTRLAQYGIKKRDKADADVVERDFVVAESKILQEQP